MVSSATVHFTGGGSLVGDSAVGVAGVQGVTPAILAEAIKKHRTWPAGQKVRQVLAASYRLEKERKTPIASLKAACGRSNSIRTLLCRYQRWAWEQPDLAVAIVLGI